MSVLFFIVNIFCAWGSTLDRSPAPEFNQRQISDLIHLVSIKMGNSDDNFGALPWGRGDRGKMIHFFKRFFPAFMTGYIFLLLNV